MYKALLYRWVMRLDILYKNKDRCSYDGVRKVYNLSANFIDDYLCAERIGDFNNKPSVMIKLDTILCFRINDDTRRVELDYETKDKG